MIVFSVGAAGGAEAAAAAGGAGSFSFFSLVGTALGLSAHEPSMSLTARFPFATAAAAEGGRGRRRVRRSGRGATAIATLATRQAVVAFISFSRFPGPGAFSICGGGGGLSGSKASKLKTWELASAPPAPEASTGACGCLPLCRAGPGRAQGMAAGRKRRGAHAKGMHGWARGRGGAPPALGCAGTARRRLRRRSPRIRTFSGGDCEAQERRRRPGLRAMCITIMPAA
mmetsp:Transcript_27272/g.87388  ORF Transcript_27272/g.87388 Transcript_27272/m.87388 type:complete len:228 (-) Transcript_27272:211-894(-)